MKREIDKETGKSFQCASFKSRTTKLQNKKLPNIKELLSSLTFEELTELSGKIKKDKE